MLENKKITWYNNKLSIIWDNERLEDVIMPDFVCKVIDKWLDEIENDANS